MEEPPGQSADVDPAIALTDADYVNYPGDVRRGWGRSAFLQIVRHRFDEITLKTPLDSLTFWFAVFGAPWRFEWDGANFSGMSRQEEDVRADAIADGMAAARHGEPGFYRTGYHSDAGGGWIGVQQGHGRDETRVYDREPIVVSREQYEDTRFSGHWFEPTVGGTILLAAALLPQLHPELKAVAMAWRLANPQHVPMLVNDRINHPHFFQPGTGESPVITGILPTAVLLSDPLTVAKSQQRQFIRTVLAHYNVPPNLHQRSGQ